MPTHVPALLKLVEICVDGGLEAAMYEAQAQLADAYLSSSQAAEARFIAEDLVAREPWEAAHIERFRRALVMLRVPEPDTVIAERLSGQTPFTATDHFSDPVREEPPPPPAPIEEAVPEPAPNPSRRRRRRSARPRGACSPPPGEVQTARPGRDRSDECARRLAGRRGGSAAARRRLPDLRGRTSTRSSRISARTRRARALPISRRSTCSSGGRTSRWACWRKRPPR